MISRELVLQGQQISRYNTRSAYLCLLPLHYPFLFFSSSLSFISLFVFLLLQLLTLLPFFILISITFSPNSPFPSFVLYLLLSPLLFSFMFFHFRFNFFVFSSFWFSFPRIPSPFFKFFLVVLLYPPFPLPSIYRSL